MRSSNQVNSLLYWCGFALIALAIASGLIEPLLLLRRYIPLDSNEGWNAYFSSIAMSGGALYPPPDSLITNNYPPLSFYIVGMAGRLVGDTIFAGRLIALLSLFWVTWCIYSWLRVTGSTVRIALVGAAAFLAFVVTYAQFYVGMNDPQWLAHAIMLSGLVVLWRGEASTRALIVACVLMVVAGWTKHLLIPVPLATTLWLLLRSRRAFFIWIVCAGLLVTAAAAMTWWIYGPDVFHGLMAGRQYSRHLAFTRTSTAVEHFAPIVVLSIVMLAKAFASQRTRFAAIYLVVSAGIAASASGGAGVDVNAYFDLMIACGICTGLAIDMLWSRGTSPGDALTASAKLAACPAVIVLALGISTASYAAMLVPGTIAAIRDIDLREATSLREIRLLADVGKGRAACEGPALCYWAKTPFMLDFFMFGQKLKTGRLPESACEAAFGARISMVQLESSTWHGSKQLTEDCNHFIYEHYQPIPWAGPGALLLPVGVAAPVATAVPAPKAAE